MPVRRIIADDNDDFYRQLAQLEKDEGVQLLKGSIICTISEQMRIPDPPKKKVPVDALSAAEAAL